MNLERWAREDIWGGWVDVPLRLRYMQATSVCWPTGDNRLVCRKTKMAVA